MLLHLLFSSSAISEHRYFSFGKGKTLYQLGRVHEVNCKSAKGNFVIKFHGILRNSGAHYGAAVEGQGSEQGSSRS